MVTSKTGDKGEKGIEECRWIRIAARRRAAVGRPEGGGGKGAEATKARWPGHEKGHWSLQAHEQIAGETPITVSLMREHNAIETQRLLGSP